MRYLGIDPGLLNLGYAVVEKDGNRILVLDAGTLKTNPKDLLPLRLHQLYRALIEIIRNFSPIAVVVEEPLPGVNPHTTSKVIQVYATVLLASTESQIEVFTFKPTEWKRALFGFGQISKASMIKSLQALLNQQNFHEGSLRDEHLLDALCLSLLGALSKGSSQAGERLQTEKKGGK